MVHQEQVNAVIDDVRVPFKMIAEWMFTFRNTKEKYTSQTE